MAVPSFARYGLMPDSGFRSGDHIRDIERPHDLEALEHGEDLVVYPEPFTARLSSEIAAMGIEPPVSRAVPLPLVPSKRLVDLGQRLDRYLGGSPDEPWRAFAVWHDGEIAGPRCRLATFSIIACQAGRGPLDPGDDQMG
jgi:hypothetical protein